MTQSTSCKRPPEGCAVDAGVSTCLPPRDKPAPQHEDKPRPDPTRPVPLSRPDRSHHRLILSASELSHSRYFGAEDARDAYANAPRPAAQPDQDARPTTYPNGDPMPRRLQIPDWLVSRLAELEREHGRASLLIGDPRTHAAAELDARGITVQTGDVLVYVGGGVVAWLHGAGRAVVELVRLDSTKRL